MRMVNYAAWVGRRWQDPAFPRSFTWFGSERYWAEHILELREQLAELILDDAGSDAIKEQAGKVGELAQQVADLTNAAELADKSKEEQAQIIAQRAAAQSEAEIAGLRQSGWGEPQRKAALVVS